jgi:putative transposase
MNALKHRGISDVLIAVVDGLKGFPEAITAVFPQTIVQTCIIPLIRHSMDFASWKDRKVLAGVLKTIYRAKDADAARAALEAFDASQWGQKYPAIAQSWRRNWERAIPFFAFPEAVRRILYTTDEIDERFLCPRALCRVRERPRGEARRVGCKRRQASYSFLAGLRRSRASAFDGRVLQPSTKRAELRSACWANCCS